MVERLFVMAEHTRGSSMRVQEHSVWCVGAGADKHRGIGGAVYEAAWLAVKVGLGASPGAGESQAQCPDASPTAGGHGGSASLLLWLGGRWLCAT